MKKDIIITIFGATGDLTMRKLLPALQSLYLQESMFERLQVIAIGRKDYTSESYLQEMQKQNSNLSFKTLSQFVVYHRMEFTSGSDYRALHNLIQSHAESKTKQLYYLATSPTFFEEIAKHLSQENIVQKGNHLQRVLFEKPFGTDLKSAKQINTMLWQFFDEEQIYRIDHYLGKEMIQNIMTMRFANRIYEAVWNKKHIKSITIYAKEELGILSRGGFYDEAGALKDMVQSHLLQVLALLGMNAPKTYFSKDVKNQKVSVLKRLSFASTQVLFGQYEGYLSEQNVKENSTTETFVFLKTQMRSGNLKGVPIYIITGKKLSEKKSGILIEFHATKEQHKWNLSLQRNHLHIEISPKDGMQVLFNSKVPNLRNQIQPVLLEYDTNSSAVGNIPEAYERLLLDAVESSKMLFTRWDEMELLWKFTDKIKQKQKDLFVYQNESDLKNEIESRFKTELKV